MSPTIIQDAEGLRRAGHAELAATASDLRARLLRLFDAYEAALPPDLTVRLEPELNPPLWELGHIGWFEEFWIARNPQRLQGVAADPDVARAAALLPGADALYDSSRVAHPSRWRLPLPDGPRTRRYLAQVRERCHALLAQTEGDDTALYVFRLALVHEAMHLEAWAHMAQNLALDIGTALPQTAPAPTAATGEIDIAAQAFQLGRSGGGFSFDNEIPAHEVEIAAFTIDAAPLTWARFLPFVEDGGYETPTLWTAEGWAWRQRAGQGHPRFLLQTDGRWQRATFGRWTELGPAQPAVNLNAHEAQAWCRWAGRRLPTEAEWECAAVTCAGQFDWGQVWEWTSSEFVPYPGFEAHPYRDYSQPWFDGRPVLRGASFATLPAMKHARYRNYYPADRNDVFAGFRTCAV